MWPPRLPDLNPCDFQLLVFYPLPKTLDDMKKIINKKRNKKYFKNIYKFTNFEKRCNLFIST